MKYEFNSKEELTKFVAENIINTSEVVNILGCSRQNISDLIARGKIKPVKEMVRDKLFWKSDILERVKLKESE